MEKRAVELQGLKKQLDLGLFSRVRRRPALGPGVRGRGGCPTFPAPDSSVACLPSSYGATAHGELERVGAFERTELQSRMSH